MHSARTYETFVVVKKAPAKITKKRQKTTTQKHPKKMWDFAKVIRCDGG